MKLLLSAAVAALLVCGCATEYVAPNGVDQGDCRTQGQPCRTIAYALSKATSSDGDLILMADGVYPPQVVPAGSHNAVILNNNEAATVRATATDGFQATLEVQGTDITFDGVNVDSNNLVRQGLAIHNGRVTFKRARVGNVTDEKGALVSGPDITFDDVDFHDVWLQTAGVHNECVYAIVTERIEVVNSSFTNCATMDLMFTYGNWWTPLPPDWGNGTVENNTFDCPRFENGAGCHYYSLLWNGAMPSIHGFKVRNNHFVTRNPGAPGSGDIGIDKPFQGGVRCGNTESQAGVLDAVWKQPC